MIKNRQEVTLLKKLTETKKHKREFIERMAFDHICDYNCLAACDLEEVPKLSLLSMINAEGPFF